MLKFLWLVIDKIVFLAVLLGIYHNKEVMKLSEELKWRGFVNQTTISNLTKLDENKLSFYHGYDASAESVTIGNLASIMLDRLFIKHGHKPIILAGGATSLIGDPGGKDSERPLQSESQVRRNVELVSKQIQQLFGAEATFVNNLDWYKDIRILDFLRNIGKHFSMTPLVQRDYIAKRLGEGGSGITYTEFSYTLLQGYDYLYLYQKYGVTLQLAGSDQWGNSLSGVDLVRRVETKTVDVLTCPLVINSQTGKKFGKSEAGAIWLDPKLTSVYKFYQFWLNLPDDGVENYLKIYTDLDKEQIDATMKQFNSNKAERVAQKLLASEVTKLVHGFDATESVLKVTEVLFGNQDYKNLTEQDMKILIQDLPVLQVHRGQSMIDSIVEAKFLSSKSEARRQLNQGAIYVNGKTLNTDKVWHIQDTLDSQHCILRVGKNNNAVVQIN